MATEGFLNSLRLTLQSDITDVDTSIPFSEFGTTMPGGTQFRMKIEDEIILVESYTLSSLDSLTRGAEGTTAAPHVAGALITHLVTAGAIDQLKRDAQVPEIYLDPTNSGPLHNYSAATLANMYVITPVGSQLSITGWSSNGFPAAITILNGSGGEDIVLRYEDAGSAPSNRFYTAMGVDTYLAPDEFCQIVYDTNILRWRILYALVVGQQASQARGGLGLLAKEFRDRLLQATPPVDVVPLLEGEGASFLLWDWLRGRRFYSLTENDLSLVPRLLQRAEGDPCHDEVDRVGRPERADGWVVRCRSLLPQLLSVSMGERGTQLLLSPLRPGLSNAFLSGSVGEVDTVLLVGLECSDKRGPCRSCIEELPQPIVAIEAVVWAERVEASSAHAEDRLCRGYQVFYLDLRDVKRSARHRLTSPQELA